MFSLKYRELRWIKSGTQISQMFYARKVKKNVYRNWRGAISKIVKERKIVELRFAKKVKAMKILIEWIGRWYLRKKNF